MALFGSARLMFFKNFSTCTFISPYTSIRHTRVQINRGIVSHPGELDNPYYNNLEFPNTHQDSSEWKPITTKSNPIQQKSRYEYHKPRSSRRNYKYKRYIDPNDNIADIYDSNTREQGNLLKEIDNKTFRR